MAWILVGLGNPGDEYTDTRHNSGRMALEYFAKRHDFSAWKSDKSAKSSVSKGTLGKQLVALVAPDTFMNKSGSAVAKFVKSPKAAERLVVLYDDLDLPLGSMKLSYDRGSGGHKGLESVMRSVKTKKFARVRLGVSPSTAAGKTKKPQGEKEVLKFILQRFSLSDREILQRVFKKACAALEKIVEAGVPAAMNEFN